MKNMLSRRLMSSLLDWAMVAAAFAVVLFTTVIMRPADHDAATTAAGGPAQISIAGR